MRERYGKAAKRSLGKSAGDETGAEADGDRRQLREWKKQETSNVQSRRKKSLGKTRVIGFHRAGRRGEDDLDRRARPASVASRTESAHRNSFARSERGRRRCVARRSRDHDQFAGRSRFHAQHGDARTGRRFVAGDGRLPRAARAMRISITSSSKRSAPARKRCRSKASWSIKRCW